MTVINPPERKLAKRTSVQCEEKGKEKQETQKCRKTPQKK